MILRILKDFYNLQKDLNQIEKIIPQYTDIRLCSFPIELYQDMCRVYLDEYKKVEIMALEEAHEIVYNYEACEDRSCSCHLGNPPCGKCVTMPDKDTYERALEIIENFEKEERP